MDKTIFVTYNTASEKKEAFKRSLGLRKQWEEKMKKQIESYRQEGHTI